MDFETLLTESEKKVRKLGGAFRTMDQEGLECAKARALDCADLRPPVATSASSPLPPVTDEAQSRLESTEIREVREDGEVITIDPREPWSKRGPLELKHRHRMIMYMVLDGWTNQQIAERMGMPVRSVGIIQKSPLFKSEIRKLQQRMEDKVLDVTERFRTGAPRAYDVISKILDMPADSFAMLDLKRRAALDYLKYGGYKPPERTVVTHDFGATVKEAWEKRRKLLAGESGESGEMGGNGNGARSTETAPDAPPEASAPLDLDEIELKNGEFFDFSLLNTDMSEIEEIVVEDFEKKCEEERRQKVENLFGSPESERKTATG